MGRVFDRAVAVIGALLMAAGLSSSAVAAPKAGPRVLVFSHSTGYRHASIEPAVAALKAMGPREGFRITASEDPNVFNEARLRDFDVILLLSNSTNPKDTKSEYFVGERRSAFQNFVRRGGGVVAVHAASDSHYHWDWYGRMIGGYFVSHPEGTPKGEVRVVDGKHRSTAGLPARTARVDEWYYFQDHNPETHLLVSLDPASIGQKDVNPNPVSWAHEFDGGRVFYTAMGHTAESYQDPFVMRHLAGAIRWAAKR